MVITPLFISSIPLFFFQLPSVAIQRETSAVAYLYVVALSLSIRIELQTTGSRVPEQRGQVETLGGRNKLPAHRQLLLGIVDDG